MARTRIEILKGKYGFNKFSYEYIPAGSEILKWIGQVVIFCDHKRNESGEWEVKIDKAQILSIADFNPMTMTYKVKYKLDNEEEEKELEIIPEGYSWGNPEETGVMQRFIPYSLHCKLVETEIFYARLKELWGIRKTLPIESLKTISESKEKDKILKYSNHIAAIIKLDDTEDILYFRLHSLKIRHRAGKNYNIAFGDGETVFNIMVDSEQDTYRFEDLGDLKFIDLASEPGDL